MTTYAASIYNYVGRRLSWSSTGGSDEPQRPSSHDLLAGESCPSAGGASSSISMSPSHQTSHPHPHRSSLLPPRALASATTLRPPPGPPGIDVQADSDLQDAVSEQTLVAIEHIPARALRTQPPIPDAGDPASYSRDLGAAAEAAAGEPDNSTLNNATSNFDPPSMSPPEGSSQIQTSSSAAARLRVDLESTTEQSALEETSTMAQTPLEETTFSNTTTARIPTPGHDSASNDEPNTNKSSALPADDGKRALRQCIVEILKLHIGEREKARRIHAVMTEDYNTLKEQKKQSKQAEIPPPENDNPFEVTPEDAQKSYHKDNELGCSHYKRGVKIQCSTCQKWYTCRFCHDEMQDHPLIRRETKNMLCMHCGKAQPAQQDCRHCGVKSAKYYCDKCKLWDDDAEKKIYHCDDCGICRIGTGLGKDYFHCKKCGVCMSIRLEEYHRCIERSTECDCPICGEFMFTSTMTVVFMKCGHSIHHKCYYEHMKSSYRCPTCYRTIINMESQFRALDNEIANQVLPAPYDTWRSLIACNDCSARSNVPFHFLGLKCETCRSYNTNQVRLIRSPSTDDVELGQSPPTGDAGSGQSTTGDAEFRHSTPAQGRQLGGTEVATGVRVGGTPTLHAATVAIGNAGAAIDMVTSSSISSAGADARLVYDDGWDNSGEEEEEGEGSAAGDDESWDRWGSEAADVDERGLVPGLGALGGLSLFGSEGAGDGREREAEQVLEEDDEEEEDDFLNLTGHR